MHCWQSGFLMSAHADIKKKKANIASLASKLAPSFLPKTSRRKERAKRVPRVHSSSLTYALKKKHQLAKYHKLYFQKKDVKFYRRGSEMPAGIPCNRDQFRTSSGLQHHLAKFLQKRISNNCGRTMRSRASLHSWYFAVGARLGGIDASSCRG